MGATDSFLETGIDRLKHMVVAQHEISVAAAADRLKVSPGVVEAWAEALHESKSIEVRQTLR